MRRLLWAEDSPTDQHLIREAVRNMPDPPHLEFVEDGVQLLERVDEARPGMIVLDLSMPRMGGLETLERLQPRQRRVGVVVFTAHDGPGEALQCLRRGAAEVIQKPTDYLEFVGAVQRICTHSAWAVADAPLLPAIAVP